MFHGLQKIVSRDTEAAATLVEDRDLRNRTLFPLAACDAGFTQVQGSLSSRTGPDHVTHLRGLIERVSGMKTSLNGVVQGTNPCAPDCRNQESSVPVSGVIQRHDSRRLLDFVNTGLQCVSTGFHEDRYKRDFQRNAVPGCALRNSP